MTKFFLLMCWLTLCADASVHGQSAASNQDVSEYKINKIVSIKVTVSTRRDNYNPKETCETFVMTPKRAKAFLSHSATSTYSGAFHQESFSSCESEGTVIFANGDQGEWLISRNGRGFLSLTSGKYKDLMVHLHCYRCENWKF